jgi:hypothetical protein
MKMTSKEMNWQPINTAPRDGSFVLMWNGADMRVLNWPKGCGLGIWHKNVSGGWSGSSNKSYYFCPTHWMELPEPPKDNV